MVCQYCGKKNALTHIQTFVNGTFEEYYLCEDCAIRRGRSSLLQEDQPADRAVEEAAAQEMKCPCCGKRFSDFVRTETVGCAQCYDIFRSCFEPLIRHIYGDAEHVGKVPSHASRKAKYEEAIEQLRQKLAYAVETENYEDAVILRNQIRQMEETKGVEAR